MKEGVRGKEGPLQTGRQTDRQRERWRHGRMPFNEANPATTNTVEGDKAHPRLCAPWRLVVHHHHKGERL